MTEDTSAPLPTQEEPAEGHLRRSWENAQGYIATVQSETDGRFAVAMSRPAMPQLPATIMVILDSEDECIAWILRSQYAERRAAPDA